MDKILINLVYLAAQSADLRVGRLGSWPHRGIANCGTLSLTFSLTTQQNGHAHRTYCHVDEVFRTLRLRGSVFAGDREAEAPV